MKMRVIVATVLTAATVTACSSGGSGGSGHAGGSPAGGHTTPSASFCKQLSSAVHDTRGLRSAFANPQQMGSKLQPLISSFESLKGEAPPNVSRAIDDLLSSMRAAHQAIAGGNMRSLRHQMTQILPKVENDFTVIGRYVATQCKGVG